MHGRLKIKTTAQQEAERKAQRQEKLQTYQKAIEAIFANRKAIKADANPEQKDILIKTQMKLTSGVLMANPDISTLWNIRKQILNDILTVQDNEEEAHDIILRKELDLTVQCLQNNPKSSYEEVFFVLWERTLHGIARSTFCNIDLHCLNLKIVKQNRQKLKIFCQNSNKVNK